jgi:serine/threonine protein kinase
MPPDPPAAPSADVPDELARHPDYEVVRELGRGGMGVVYLVRNKLMHRTEVLKVVGRAVLDRPGAADRFLREVRSAGRLSHPNIVTAYAALRLGEQIALAMEYVDGENLSDVVRDRGRLAVPLASFCGRQAALGLQHAHEHGTIHRDIKPANLILGKQNGRPVVKILDFGLAKAVSEKYADTALTQTGQVLGTPAFMAPEQITGAQATDIRADVYSLGCTLYFLLAGEPPFRGGMHSLLYAHAHQDAVPLDQVRPDVPAGLAAVVARMMAKDPADRYQTPAEVAKALAPFVKPGSAPPAGPSPPSIVPAAETTPASATVLSTRLPASPPPPASTYPVAIPVPVPATPAPSSSRSVFAEIDDDPPARARPRRQSSVLPLALGLAGGAAVVVLAVVALFALGVLDLRRSAEPSAEPTNRGDQAAPKTTLPTQRKVEDTKPKTPPATDGRVFNGTDLTGWTAEVARTDGWYAPTALQKVWTVEAGAIVARAPGDGSDHYLVFHREYADFSLKLDVLLEAGANAGMVVRGADGELLPVNPGGMASVPGHPVVKLYDTDTFKTYPSGTTHWLKDAATFVQPDLAMTTGSGTWLAVEVDVRGRTCTVRLGSVTVATVTADPAARGVFGQMTPGLARPKGKFGLQVLSGTVRFRDIQLQERPAE